MRLRLALAFGLLTVSITAGLAQEAPTNRPFSPLSGPNTPVPSPICDIVNFGFCPQPAPPPPVLPDPEADAVPPPRPLPPPPAMHHRRRHAHHAASVG